MQDYRQKKQNKLIEINESNGRFFVTARKYNEVTGEKEELRSSEVTMEDADKAIEMYTKELADWQEVKKDLLALKK